MTMARAANPNTYRAYVVGSNSGEPSIGFDPLRNVAMYQGGRTTTRMAFDDSVVPAKLTKTVVSPSTVTSLDPIGFVDQSTGRTYASQLLAATSHMYYSDDAG